MFAIIGIIVVFGAVVGGYLLEHGNIHVLLQPAELLIIGGAASGTILVANPLHVLKKILGGLTGVLKGSGFNKQHYLNTLKMMYEIFQKARKDGMVALEGDIEEPHKSPLFKKYPAFLKDKEAVGFVCDTMRVALTGGVETFDVDQMMELDMEVQRHESETPVNALSTMADSLPGLGIVAAVLGVVIAMSALGGDQSEIGQKVAAALVGTFLGVLLCYGLVGPISQNMAKTIEDEHAALSVLRVMIIAFMKGTSPIMAIEIGRRAIPGHVRPSFAEVEKACRGTHASAAAAAAAGQASGEATGGAAAT
jgi:chemotaxis protein MotA